MTSLIFLAVVTLVALPVTGVVSYMAGYKNGREYGYNNGFWDCIDYEKEGR